MSVIEAVTVVRFRYKGPTKGRRRKLRGTKRLAYRDAAWAKIRARCECTFPVSPEEPPRELCRYHDREYRADAGGPEDPPTFHPPAIWGLPRSGDDGFWDYGRAVAHRLARLYAHLDAARGALPEGEGGGT